MTSQAQGFMANWQREAAGVNGWQDLTERQSAAEQARVAEAGREHEAQLRRQHEARHERDRVWGARRHELEAALAAAETELRFCRGRLASDDPVLRREAAMEVGALERLAEQAAADLALWTRQAPGGF